MITEALIRDIANHVSGQVLDNGITQNLRVAFPEVHFTYCMDDDVISSKPVVVGEGFNLYLIDSRDHCLTITSSYPAATGVVVAEVVEEDE